jgi:hypothetical protein
MENEDLVKEYWTKKLNVEVDKIGLTCICQSQQENAMSRARKLIKERCDNTERQDTLSKMRKEVSLVFCCEVKQRWCKEVRIDCARNKGNGVAWWGAGF